MTEFEDEFNLLEAWLPKKSYMPTLDNVLGSGETLDFIITSYFLMVSEWRR